MNENEVKGVVQNLDNDLFDRELEPLMDGIEIDVDSILDKALCKLEQEERKVKKKKLIPIVAAAACLMIGTTAVYAQEISDFIRSFFGQSTVYSTVVDGDAYYLESPLPLEGGGQIYSAMFTGDRLDLIVDGDVKMDEVSLTMSDGTEHLPGGLSYGPNGMELTFYFLEPEQNVEITVNGKKYSLALTSAASVLDGGDIQPAEPNTIEWVNMGYKRTSNGVQIFTSFTDENLNLKMIGLPVRHEVKETFTANVSSSNSAPNRPIMGYDQNGNAYEYVYEENPVAWPVTRFESDAPAGQEITLKIPGIIVGYQEIITSFNLAIPGIGEESRPNQEIDLGIQKMVLESIACTSATTAELKFKLNTGERGEVSINEVSIVSEDLPSGEALWKGDACTMTVTFEEGLTQTEIIVGWPSFLVNGDWVFILK